MTFRRIGENPGDPTDRSITGQSILVLLALRFPTALRPQPRASSLTWTAPQMSAHPHRAPPPQNRRSAPWKASRGHPFLPCLGYSPSGSGHSGRGLHCSPAQSRQPLPVAPPPGGGVLSCEKRERPLCVERLRGPLPLCGRGQ